MPQLVHQLLQILRCRSSSAPVSLLCCYQQLSVVELQTFGQRRKHKCAVSLPLQPSKIITWMLADEGLEGLAAGKAKERRHIRSSKVAASP
jgi:hypothetical protein